MRSHCQWVASANGASELRGRLDKLPPCHPYLAPASRFPPGLRARLWDGDARRETGIEVGGEVGVRQTHGRGLRPYPLRRTVLRPRSAARISIHDRTYQARRTTGSTESEGVSGG